MKTKLLLLILVIGTAFTQVRAQYVAIPDSNFGKWLYNNGYSGCMTGTSPNFQLDTTCNAVLSATDMEISSQNIKSITGVEFFKNLLFLTCRINNIDSIGKLPNTLTNLDCSENIIHSILAFPSNMLFVNCDRNNLTSLPALPNSTTSFTCQLNHLTSLPSLPAALQGFSCNYNLITALPSLPSGLMILNCGTNQISNLQSPLPITLTELGVQDNRLTSLPALPMGLTSLGCDVNRLDSLPNLPVGLSTLTCSYNRLVALPTLPVSMKHLECLGNQIIALPFLPDSINHLDCGGNRLTSLPVLPRMLKLLYCDTNQLTSLPTLRNSQLTDLVCSNNLLTSIPELPDSLNVFYCSLNHNLMCLPELKIIHDLDFDSTGVSCLSGYGSITNSNPALSSLPLCGPNNLNGCQPAYNISGQTYHDVNSNCINDAGDINISNIKILLYNNGQLQQQRFAGQDGYYSFNAYNVYGNYAVKPDTAFTPFSVNCPIGGWYLDTISATDSIFPGNDFALNCKVGFDLGVFDIREDLNTIPRPGTLMPLNITAGDLANQYGSYCTSGIGGQLQVILSGQTSYYGVASNALSPTSVNGDTITWVVTDFSTIHNRGDFNIILRIDSNSQSGSKVCINANITPTIGDNNVTNNRLSYCLVIANALDPNTKEVYPSGNVDTTQDWLVYTVRFQNTGTAPALNIYILDTLSANVDESTIQMVSASHPILITQVDGKVVRFNFPNISLPDSTADEPHSHGYVRYKVKPKHGLSYGNTISNTANIYFDLNPAVVTNTVTTTLAKDIDGIAQTKNAVGELAVNIYPNPANNLLNIVADAKGTYIIRLLDVNGGEVKSLNGNGTTTLDISTLSKGMYFVEVHSNGMVARKKVVKI